MNQRKSLKGLKDSSVKDSSGSSVTIICIYIYTYIYIYIYIPKNLGPSKWKGLNPYNRGVLVLKMTPVLRVQ